MSMLPIHLVAEDGTNIRRTPATADEQEALRASIASQGILEPLLVRPNGAGGYKLVFGHRRYRAALDIGLTEIPAEIREMTDAEAMAAQAAENMVRAAMPPYDIWRAMAALLDAGHTLASAGAALGLSPRRAAQLEKLGRMHADVLAVIDKTGTVPGNREAEIIASAPEKLQRAAVKNKDSWINKNEISWNGVARLCNPPRISLSCALFKLEDALAISGLTFEEDLFAEPGSDEQFTTTQVEKFMHCQTEALRAHVEARAAAGEQIEMITELEHGRVKLPRGWSERYGAADLKCKKAGGPKRFMWVQPANTHHAGAIKEVVADPPASRAAKAKQAAQPDDTKTEDGAPAAEEAEDQFVGITKKGTEAIAAAKTTALRRHLRDETPDPNHVLAALILAFCADNVAVRGAEHDSDPARRRNADLVARVIDPAGQLIADAPLYAIAAELLARNLLFTAAHENSTYRTGSGTAAEWIGAMIGADASLPRFDTDEFLPHMKGDALRVIALDNMIKPAGKLAALRDEIKNNAPSWRPTTFGAPGPVPPTERPVEINEWDNDA